MLHGHAVLTCNTGPLGIDPAIRNPRDNAGVTTDDHLIEHAIFYVLHEVPGDDLMLALSHARDST
jgi:hypothetical protein